MKSFYSTSLLLLFLATAAVFTMTEAADEAENAESDKEDVSSENLDYAKGSVCGYCEYCKFCKLCDQDCPCETSARKPNCKMCKYCKYCYLCSAVCDTICTPDSRPAETRQHVINTGGLAELVEDLAVEL